MTGVPAVRKGDGMKLIYFDTLYGREAELVITGTIEFKACGIEFANMGKKDFIEYENILRIESTE